MNEVLECRVCMKIPLDEGGTSMKEAFYEKTLS
jgi:hypothetical protein